MVDLVKLGSETAKNGFKNEEDIIRKFNNWETDEDAKKWLLIMEYKLKEIQYVKAIKVSQYKTDVQINVTIKLKSIIDVQNLQVKLVSNKNGFNQIDKRWIIKYVEMWNIPKNIQHILQLYTGELPPETNKFRDKRRMFANEFTEDEKKLIMSWLKKNQSLIVSDILKGRGKLSAEWMLVAQKIHKSARWVLKPMNFCLNFFGNGNIEITNRGNFKIGKITMQRKGGDGGRDTAKMLQFKINPATLFNT